MRLARTFVIFEVAWTYVISVSSYKSVLFAEVVVKGSCSPLLPVLSGVPQGSVLGPLLFLIFINYITSQVSMSSSLSLFADDMALYHPITSIADFQTIQCNIYVQMNSHKTLTTKADPTTPWLLNHSDAGLHSL